jgi:hypothetical protein
MDLEELLFELISKVKNKEFAYLVLGVENKTWNIVCTNLKTPLFRHYFCGFLPLARRFGVFIQDSVYHTQK